MAGEQGTAPPRRGNPPVSAILDELVPPWKPPQWDPSIATAFQALARGDCPAHLQIAALGWLLNDCCQIRALAFHPGSTRDTDFALGKQFVGHQVAKLLTHQAVKKGEQG